MGYDLKMVRTPESVPPGHKPQYDGQPEYHRFNIHWMPLVREMMQRARVLDDYGEPGSAFPKWPPHGMDAARAEAVAEYLTAAGAKVAPAQLTPGEKEAVEEYLRGRAAVQAETSPDAGRVGYWKFCSNDGWLVTPDECRIIADKLTAALARDEALWDDLDVQPNDAVEALTQWIGFARLAADHGGFRVF